MDAIPPQVFRWSGEAMIPRHGRIADKHFVIGQEYLLQEHHQRSPASEGHYFACIKSAWDSLPEDDAERFPTTEHLRKHALIKAGYYEVTTYACNSQAEAVRTAAVIRSIDPYAVVKIGRDSVLRFTAKSQSRPRMGHKDFQASKDAVLAVLAEMIHVEPDQLASAAA